MRCYFMRAEHIATVALLPGLTDDEAVKKSRKMYEDRKIRNRYDGFEVWDMARVVKQYLPAVEDGKSS